MSHIATVHPPTAPRLALFTLGRWRLVPVDDAADAAQFGPSKPLALLVYLALSPDRTAPREHLIDLLWADRGLDAGANALRQTVWFIRRRLGDASLVTEGGNLVLAATVDVDRDAFLAAVQRRDHETALELYRGDFLPGFATPGGAEFEKWADLERDRLRSLFIRASHALARERLSEGKAREAVRIARRARETDPDVEASWRVLLEGLIAAGDAIGAVTEADALEQLLIEEAREAEPATRAVLRAARHSPATDEAAAAGSQLVAELVGRETEFSAIIAAWERVRRGGSAHIHVVAPAGLGKTRLLTDVLARLRSAGARVVGVRANPGERALSFALVSELASRLVELPGAKAVSAGAAATLVRMNPALNSAFPNTATAPTPPGDDARLHRSLALTELTAAVAEESPLAIIIDDIHWADDASRVILGSLAERTASQQVLLVSASRPRPESQLARNESQILSLAPLEAAHIRELLTSVARLPEEPWAEGLVAGLVRATHGSPLLVLESLQLALDQGLLHRENNTWRCTDPSGLAALLTAGSALRRRLTELTRNQTWLLLLLSLDGVPVPLQVIETAIGRGPQAVGEDLHALEQRALITRAVDGWVPTHDEIAAEAVQGASSEAITAAHEALGRSWRDSASDVGSATRALSHFLACDAYAEITALCCDRVRRQRRTGDRRRASEIVAPLVDRIATPEQRHRILASLPLRLRLGLDRPRRVAAALAATTILGGSALAAAVSRRVVADAELLVEMRMASGEMRVVRVPLVESGWTATDPIMLDDFARFRGPTTYTVYNAPTISPDGRWWASMRPGNRATGTDIFVSPASGTPRQLTSDSGDENPISWTVDSRRILASVGVGGIESQYKIVALDPVTGSRDTLTRGRARDDFPLPSPDGSRFAFARTYAIQPDRPNEVCVSPLAPGLERCVPMPQGGYPQMAGWQGNDTLLVVRTLGDRSDLLSLDLATGAFVELMPAHSARSSPDGRWISLRTQVAVEGGMVFSIARTGQPRSARQLIAPPGAAIVGAYWLGARAWPQIANVILRPLEAPLGVGKRVAFSFVAHDQFGSAMPGRGGIWWSSDMSVVSVDSSTGRANTRRAGQAVIFVRVGHVRDSVSVSVAPTTPQEVFREGWTGDAEQRWHYFGSPWPMTVTTPFGWRAFFNNGLDGSHTSGAYTDTVPASGGIGVEATLVTPVRLLVGQMLHVEISGNVDESSLTAWNHRTGGLPRLQERPDACTWGIPTSTDLTTTTLSTGVDAQTSALPPTVLTGRPYRLRLQLFEDGRCGVAINGVPTLLSRSRVSLRRPMRVILGGNSVGTRLLVGPLAVWRGVRDDIDWATIDSVPPRQ